MEQQQDSLSWLDWLLIGLLLLSLAGFCWYWYQASATSTDIRQQISASWTNVLAIDMVPSDSDTPSEATIVNGEDGILLAPPSLDRPFAADRLLDYTSVSNFQNIGMLSPVTTNIFDPQDAVFAKLRLLMYADHGTRMKLVPLYQAGIRAIELDRGKVLVRFALHNIDAKQVLGYVVMSDGSQRFIHYVPVYNQILQGQAMPESD